MEVEDTLETNTSDANDTVETVLEDFEVFDMRDVLNVVAYSVMSSGVYGRWVKATVQQRKDPLNSHDLTGGLRLRKSRTCLRNILKPYLKM